MKLPNGFSAASCSAGLKSSGALDLTLVVNNGPKFDAAAVYTSNQVVAAPVIWRKQVSFIDRLVTIDIDLKMGSGQATVFTSDLSRDYVHENSAYAS